jgi:hypothetical protein
MTYVPLKDNICVENVENDTSRRICSIRPHTTEMSQIRYETKTSPNKNSPNQETTQKSKPSPKTNPVILQKNNLPKQDLSYDKL